MPSSRRRFLAALLPLLPGGALAGPPALPPAAPAAAPPAWVAQALADQEGGAGGGPARGARGRPADVINVRDEGAVGDGVADDTAAIQRALDRLPPGYDATLGPRRVVFPNGTYRITATLVVAGKHLWQLEGAGAGLSWDGTDPAQSMLRVTGHTTRGRIDGLWFGTRGAGRRARAAMEFEGGGGAGEHVINQVMVWGAPGLELDYGILTTGPDANNDHFKIFSSHVEHVRRACVRFGHSQSKAHVLVGNRLQSFSPVGSAVSSAGSYFWWGGATGSNGGGDFVQTGISGVDAIYIGGVNSEGSRLLFGAPLWTDWAPGETYAAAWSLVRASNGLLYAATTSGVSGPREPSHAAGAASDGGVTWSCLGAEARLDGRPATVNPFPVTLESVRFSGYAMRLDGLEDLDGGNARIRPDAGAAEADSARPGATAAGFAAVVTYPVAGPLHVRNCQFQPATDPRIRRLKIVANGSLAGTNGIVVGNVIAGSSTAVPPVWAPGGRVMLLGNMLWPGPGGLDGGERAVGFPEYDSRPAAGGRPYAVLGAAGGALAVGEALDHLRLELRAPLVERLTLPRGQPGQIMTLELVQPAGRPAVMPPSAWPADVVLVQGPVLLPPEPGAVATVTLRWDPAARRGGAAGGGSWVEVGRTNAGPLVRARGAPEGAFAAPPGTLYLRTDGGAGATLYVKESGDGAAGWVAR